MPAPLSAAQLAAIKKAARASADKRKRGVTIQRNSPNVGVVALARARAAAARTGRKKPESLDELRNTTAAKSAATKKPVKKKRAK